MQDSRLEGFNKVMSSPEILYYRHLLRMHPYSTINMHGQFIIFALQCPRSKQFMHGASCMNILSRVTNMFARMEGGKMKNEIFDFRRKSKPHTHRQFGAKL
jgi:hypothetical protein